MCGIAGVLPRRPGPAIDRLVLRSMCETLAHRGPDDWGVAIGDPAVCARGDVEPHVVQFPSPVPLALAHTRLSVLDLSGAGHQPMAGEDGRVWIVYNGEVYNFRELRADLERRGCRFHSQTDTEVILRLYELDGCDGFSRLNGMFALAIWDGRSQRLHLARDRFGIKPLYYASTSDRFMFASEMKALIRAGLVPSLNLEAVHAYLSFLWVPEPETILDGVRKIPAGHVLTVSPSCPVAAPRPFWSPAVHASNGHFGDERDAADAVRESLARAVTRQAVADVPVGAFLSGGLDSSAVVALMVGGGHAPAHVHSIGFRPEDQRYERDADDLPFARQVASELGLPQHEVLLDADVVDLLPRLVWHLDEPLADPAVIPMYLVCREARGYTKVLLSGVGGDELFGGYRRHASHTLLSAYAHLPAAIQCGIRAALDAVPSGGTRPWVAGVRRAKKLLRAAPFPAGEQYIQTCTWMDAALKQSIYSDTLRGHLVGLHAERRHREVLAEAAALDPLAQMLYLDTRLYLPSHNLNYADKMSMAASVEVRVPFLDNDLVDLAWRLPSSLKVRGLTGKYILKRALEGIVPRAIIDRPKTGFAAPIRGWLANNLQEMIGDLLSPAQVTRRGLFDSGGVSRLVGELRGGRADVSFPVWALLTLELWQRAYLDGRPS